jgi:subfamily B ATP-binding cassette protein MsbA
MSSLLQRLLRITPFFRTGRIGIAVAFAGSLVGAATEPLIPALMKPLLDRGFTQGALPLWIVPAAIIGLFFVRGLAGYIAQYALSWTANSGVQELREALFARLLSAQPALFAQNSASNLTNTIVYAVQSGASQLVDSLLTLVKDSLTLVALLVYLLWLNWKLTLFVGVLAPAVVWMMRTVGQRLHRLAREGQVATDLLAYVVEENVLAWRIVRMHGAQAAQTRRFTDQANRLRRVLLKSVAAAGAMTPLTQLFTALALSAVIVVALWQSSGTGTTVGGFVAFITAMLMLVAPVKHLSDVMAPITRGLAAIERGIELIDDYAVEQGGHHDPGRAQGRITLRDVTVRYRDDQAPALQDLTLEIEPGQTVAVVGASGAGKTTLANLLPRFVDPVSGQAALDQVPLREWDVAALRRQFAFVSQDVVLFNDSVAANVALGAEPDIDRVWAVLRDAQLADYVATLPNGVNTPIGHNGSELSGGQRQRLAIARALYKDAPILILDEATSALDSESERAFQAALEPLMHRRTTIVIAHRLSTIEHAQRILVLQGGRLVEQGSHAELLAAGGLYSRLHAIQFGS